MAMLTVRNITDEVHRALRMRAAQRGHSMEAEVRDILETPPCQYDLRHLPLRDQ